jgi:hypothetical protein
MRKFEEIKTEILELANKNGACSNGVRDCKNTTNEIELIDVIVKYISWLIRSKIISAEWIESNFDKALFWERGVYTSGEHYLENPKAQVITLGSSSATVETWDSSSATVETFGSSSATVNTWDSSSATVETFGSSSATVETFGSSSATVETFGSSSATVETWDSSSATVETWDSSSATVETLGSSSKLNYSLGEGSLNTIKDLGLRKLFVKKSQFEIIEI